MLKLLSLMKSLFDFYIYIRTCHFTLNHCQTTDSIAEWYLTPESIIKIHLNRTSEVQNEKIIFKVVQLNLSAIWYLTHQNFASRVKFNHKLFWISCRIFSCSFVNTAAKFAKIWCSSLTSSSNETQICNDTLIYLF